MVRCTNEQAMKFLAQYKAHLRKRYTLQKVLLFGSRARNDHLLSSDVDLIVVSDDFAGIPFRKRCGDLLEGWDGPVDLEVLGYTHEEFSRMRKRLGIVAQAVKDGVEI